MGNTFSGLCPLSPGFHPGSSHTRDAPINQYEIHWSVNITQQKKFTHSRIEEIKFIATKWKQKKII